MGIVIKKTIPSLHLTHKDYKLNERMLKFLCGFLKERREKTFSDFSRVIFLQIFLSQKALIFYKKIGGLGGGGVWGVALIYRDAKKIGGYVMVYQNTIIQPPTFTPKQSISSFFQFLVRSSCVYLEAFRDPISTNFISLEALDVQFPQVLTL